MRNIIPISLLALSMMAQTNVVWAEENKRSVPTEILIVLAKETPGKIDPSLEKLPALRRPPFNAFQSMQVLSRPKIRLSTGKSSQLDLPNGRKMKLSLSRVLPNGRYVVKTSINRPKKADYLPALSVIASPGDPFFVAGQSYKGGTLIIGVRIKETAKPR